MRNSKSEILNSKQILSTKFKTRFSSFTNRLVVSGFGIYLVVLVLIGSIGFSDEVGGGEQ